MSSEDFRLNIGVKMVPPIVQMRAARDEPIDYSLVPQVDENSHYNSFLEKPIEIDEERPQKGLLIKDESGRTLQLLIQSYRREAQEFDDAKKGPVDCQVRECSNRVASIGVVRGDVLSMEMSLRDSIIGGKIIWSGMRREGEEDMHEEQCFLIETEDCQRAYWVFPNTIRIENGR